MSEGRTPALPRIVPPDHPQAQGERRGYSVVKLLVETDSTGTPLRRLEKEVNGLGTHIYLAELNGSDSVSVKIDVPGAGWVTMEEGDIISREFTRFWVRSNSLHNAPNSFRTLGGPCEATFYVSVGPMILRAPKKYGMRAGFFSVGGTATTAGVDAFGQFATKYAALFPKGLPAAMKFGGTLLIRNRSAADYLYVYSGVPGSFASGGGVYPDETTSLEIPPGTTLPLLIENRLANLRHPDGAGRANTLVMARSSAGAADVAFTVTLSRLVFDWSDPESTPAASGIPGLDQ